MPTEIILYGAVLLSIALGLLLIALVILYVKLFRAHNQLKAEKITLEQEALKEAEAQLSKAGKTAERIIEEARLKASEIIKGTQVFSTETKDKMAGELNRVSTEHINNFKKALTDAKAETVAVLTSVSKDLKTQAVAEVGSFKGSLQKEIQSAHVALKEAVNEGYRKVEEELGNYRQARMRQVDETIFEILREVSRRVLGKAISLDEHEELAIKALEEAKKENVL